MGEWDDWIGRSETREDVITAGLVQRFCATIHVPATGVIPQGLHWCLCLPDAPTAELGTDGHPEKGGFLPPIALPRRMWASSEISFQQPLQLGDAVTRSSTIAAINEKSGRSGKLVFVAVDHETRVGDLVAVTERQYIVYREPAAHAAEPSHTVKATSDLRGWDWQQRVIPCEKLLFRYSALSFNSHRIHYDRPYAENEEGYPGLVVQGPLTATLLLNLAASELGANRLSRFSFRGQAPAFANEPLYLVGKADGQNLAMEAIGDDGREIMTAEAVIRD